MAGPPGVRASTNYSGGNAQDKWWRLDFLISREIWQPLASCTLAREDSIPKRLDETTRDDEMAERPIDFDIYRLNKVDEDGLLPYMGRAVADDADILRIIRHATTDPDCDVETDREKAANIYKWSLREFGDIESDGISTAPICSVVLARSVVQQKGVIVTDAGIEMGTSTPDQGIAVTINITFFMERHVVAIEYKGSLMGDRASPFL
jgi:hypothetical protein